MKLSCALVACNENSHYLSFWPIVKKAWWEIVGIPAILVYIGHELPPELRDDPAVRLFQPIAAWPTATQAQVIRLLYPALLGCEGAVILSDMDMIPLQKEFFHDTIKDDDNRQFISYREPLEDERQLIMCYVAATPRTWSDLFGIQTEEDIRKKLNEWASERHADGRHGGYGWCSDQEILYQTVGLFSRTNPERVQIHMSPCGHICPRPDRLDRCLPEEWQLPLPENTIQQLQAKQLVDFHMPPYTPFRENIEAVVQVCIS